MEKLKNIVFDNEDRELFLIDDLQLTADALRYSILPKIQLAMNYAINQNDEIYKLNVFDECMIAQAPLYRLGNRPADVKKNYDYAKISIQGKRKYGKWRGIEKPNGGQLQVSPFYLDLKLIQGGLFVSLSNRNQQISKKSNKKVVKFLSKFQLRMIQ